MIIGNLKFESYFEDFTVETLPQRLFCGDFTVETLPRRLFHGDFTMETLPWRLFCGDFIIGNLKFESYFEVLYPLYVVYCLRTSKMDHCLSLVTIGWP